MKRVTRRACDDAPIPEEQETEGQRQLHSLLLQQLDTDVNIDRYVAKRTCFAPAALYKPFGEQAAGVRSLSQFQALQDGETEVAGLREVGLTDAEIELWKSQKAPEPSTKGGGVCVAPEVRAQRLQLIRDKMASRAELLCRPQRFSASRPLSRREMEIEKALFHGNDRLSFLTALYHQEGSSQDDQQGTPSDPLDALYRDFLREQVVDASAAAHAGSTSTETTSPLAHTSTGQSNTSDTSTGQSETLTHCMSAPPAEKDKICTLTASGLDSNDQIPTQEVSLSKPVAVRKKLTTSQPIGTLDAVAGRGLNGPVTVSGRIEEISDNEIRQNRETEEGIRNIPRFRNYQRGEPANVLCVKNVSPRASLAQLVSVFSRFQKDDGQPVRYRLLTGRLKGQAFISFPDVEAAQDALDLVNGYRLLDKPLVIEFSRERKEGKNCETSVETAEGPPSLRDAREDHQESDPQ